MLRITGSLRLYVLIVFSVMLISCNRRAVLEDARCDYMHHNYTRAFDKTLKLAQHGDARAQYALGTMYFYGTGTVKEPDLARYWIRCAARQCYQPAIVALQIITQERYQQYTPLEQMSGRSTSLHDRVPERVHQPILRSGRCSSHCQSAQVEQAAQWRHSPTRDRHLDRQRMAMTHPSPLVASQPSFVSQDSTRSTSPARASNLQLVVLKPEPKPQVTKSISTTPQPSSVASISPQNARKPALAQSSEDTRLAEDMARFEQRVHQSFANQQHDLSPQGSNESRSVASHTQLYAANEVQYHERSTIGDEAGQHGQAQSPSTSRMSPGLQRKYARLARFRQQHAHVQHAPVAAPSHTLTLQKHRQPQNHRTQIAKRTVRHPHASKKMVTAARPHQHIAQSQGKRHALTSKQHVQPQTTPSRVLTATYHAPKAASPLVTVASSENHHPYNMPQEDTFKTSEYTWATLQDPDNYTLQLTVTKKPAKVAQMSKQRIYGYRVVPYKFHVGKKTRYSATCGSFSNARQARKALASLPQELRMQAAIYQWKRLQPLMEPYT